MTIVANIFIAAGLLFMAASAIALVTMPDFYTRAHAVAKSETLGLVLIFIGLAFRPEVALDALPRLFFVVVFAMIANPTAVHALTRAARRAGAYPWTVIGQKEADEELGGEQK